MNSIEILCRIARPFCSARANVLIGKNEFGFAVYTIQSVHCIGHCTSCTVYNSKQKQTLQDPFQRTIVSRTSLRKQYRIFQQNLIYNAHVRGKEFFL